MTFELIETLILIVAAFAAGYIAARPRPVRRLDQTRRRCCDTKWSEGHRGTCRYSLMQGGSVPDFDRDQ